MSLLGELGVYFRWLDSRMVRFSSRVVVDCVFDELGIARRIVYDYLL